MTGSDDRLHGRNDKHAKRELTIFRGFASVCPFDINADSVRKQVPPAPDIACALSNGECLEFELVEILDSDIARLDNDALSLPQSYAKEFEALPVAERSMMEANLADACIFIDYGRCLRRHEKYSLIPEVLRLLRNVPRQYRGDLSLPGTIRDAIMRIKKRSTTSARPIAKPPKAAPTTRRSRSSRKRSCSSTTPGMSSSPTT